MSQIRRWAAICGISAAALTGSVWGADPQPIVPVRFTAAKNPTPTAPRLLSPPREPQRLPVAPANTPQRRPIPQRFIQQAANYPPPNSQQFPQGQGGGFATGGDSEVQRQLQELYEKNGREMPSMDINDIEVQSPEPGQVSGGPSPIGPGAMTGGQPQQAYAQPPQKNPNFFERVFLGKKAPPKPPQPPAQYPQRPGGNPQQVPGNYQMPAQANGQYQVAPGQVPGGQPNRQPQFQPQNPGYSQSPYGNPQGNFTPSGNVLQNGPQLGNQPLQDVGQPPANSVGPQTTPNNGQPQFFEDAFDGDEEESLEITPRKQKGITSSPTTTATSNAPAQQPAPKTPVEEPAADAPSIELPPPDAEDVPSPTSNTTTQTPNPVENTLPAASNPFTGLKLVLPSEPAAKLTPPTPPTTPAVNPSSEAPKNELPTLPPLNNQYKPHPLDTPQVEQKPTPSTAPANPFEKDVPTLTNLSDKPQASQPNLVDEARIVEMKRRLANAPGKTGYMGFCPVMLRLHRELVVAKPAITATYRGVTLTFASAECLAEFQRCPDLYLPAYDGQDAVSLNDDEKKLSGALNAAAWYQGRLYLFENAENLEIFKTDADLYMDERELAISKGTISVSASSSSKDTGKVLPLLSPPGTSGFTPQNRPNGDFAPLAPTPRTAQPSVAAAPSSTQEEVDPLQAGPPQRPLLGEPKAKPAAPATLVTKPSQAPTASPKQPELKEPNRLNPPPKAAPANQPENGKPGRALIPKSSPRVLPTRGITQ